MANEWFRGFLACPDCARDLDGTQCACGFVTTHASPLDLRPRNPRVRTLEVPVGSHAPAELDRVDVSRPVVTYDGPRVWRDSAELFSAISETMRPGIALLDLGCGPRDQAVPAQHYGAQYAGVDFSSNAADLLADAHAIPFRASTFDVVISYAVFEHLYQPLLAAQEVRRVLKSGGVFAGVVSQGEPFHDSYLHHTAFGVLELLQRAGLRPLRLWPSYDTLHSLAKMGRYSKPQRMLLALTDVVGRALPMLSPRKYFRWSEREKQLDALHRAASIAFVARKD